MQGRRSRRMARASRTARARAADPARSRPVTAARSTCTTSGPAIRGGEARTRPVLLVCGLAMRANSFYGSPGAADARRCSGRRGLRRLGRGLAHVDRPAGRGLHARRSRGRRPPGGDPGDPPRDGRRAARRGGPLHGLRQSHDVRAGGARAGAANGRVARGVAPRRARRRSQRRLSRLVPPASRFMRGADPQWAARAPSVAAAGLARWARSRAATTPTRSMPPRRSSTAAGPRRCGSWTTSTPRPSSGLAREFGYSPLTFFSQMAGAPSGPARARGGPAGAGGRPAVGRPAAGHALHIPGRAENQFFLPRGQKRT